MPKPVKVLIVEDDVSVRGIVVHVAKRTLPGARITTAGNGREALAQIAAEGADLVITDFQMPGMNGNEMVRQLRAQQLDTPVIMVSGTPDARALGEAAGISRFISKTDVSAALPAAIRSLLLAA